MNGAAGGAAMSTLDLIRTLEERGVQSAAICDSGGTDGELAALREAVGGRLHMQPLYWWNKKIRAKAWKRPLIEARQQVRTAGRVISSLAVASAARAFGAELVHTNTFLTPEGGTAARLLGLAHVWHVRELLGPEQPFELGWSLGRLRRFVERHASLVVANSQTTARHLQSLLPGVDLRIIPNGIELSAFTTLVVTRRPVPVVAMIGNLPSRTKKHVLFLEAARQVQQKVACELRIYGHDPGRRDAYADALQARAGAVRFMGHRPVADIMREIDVLVHPADNESLGRTVVEAMAAGLPVVGVAGGGVGETVVHGVTGLLAPPDDADALARFIDELVRSPQQRSAMGAAGRARAQEKYSLEACASAVAETYAEALEKPVRRVGARAAARWAKFMSSGSSA
jgi:glycosyltransferase involved in cell wall biosynthesis